MLGLDLLTSDLAHVDWLRCFAFGLLGSTVGGLAIGAALGAAVGRTVEQIEKIALWPWFCSWARCCRRRS